jgi:hypothetical protein
MAVITTTVAIPSLPGQIGTVVVQVPQANALPSNGLSSIISQATVPVLAPQPTGGSIGVPNQSAQDALQSGLRSSTFSQIASVTTIIDVPGALPSQIVPSNVPSSLVTIASPVSSAPVSRPSGPVTIGVPLPPNMSLDDPTQINFTPDPTDKFLGCISSTGLNGQPIFDGPSAYNTTFTASRCREFCDAQPGAPYKYYALTQGNLCHCSSAINQTNVKTEPNGCTIPAQGDPTQTEAGGGPDGTSVIYENTDAGNEPSNEAIDDPLQQVRPRFSLSCAQKSGFA